MAAPEPHEPRRGLRINGIVLVVLLVAAGMGITSIYYRVKAPPAVRAYRAELASVPEEPRARLGYWLRHMRPGMHQTVERVRLSARQPWLVAYVVEPADGAGPPEVWGVDLSGFEPEHIVQDGLRVVVRLPEAGLLGRVRIGGDMARDVPRYAAGAPRPPAAERAREVALFALRKLVEALPQEEHLEDARLDVEVGAGGGAGTAQ